MAETTLPKALSWRQMLFVGGIVIPLITGAVSGTAATIITAYKVRDAERSFAREVVTEEIAAVRSESAETLKRFVTREELLQVLDVRFDRLETRLVERLRR